MGFRTSINNNHSKVAESEIIGANHLEFAKSLFQQYSQQLELNNNHFPAKLAFNFYINDKITNCLRKTVNIESTRKNFYTELFQHTSLPRNYSFTSIIREINQTIERYTQQQFPITYIDKDKRRLQTPVNYLSLLVTPEDVPSNNQKTNHTPTPTNNISPAIITENELLDTIFPFELKELLVMPLFSGATLEKKPITVMYTDAKVNSHFIKLILDSGSAGSIITRQLMDQLSYQIN
ncbi:hypothetical protein G9A89_005841 [Geosiphon pyriformis]|nr:hypothetical protein G9A89_005841 [Geosiphon pyriformis]